MIDLQIPDDQASKFSLILQAGADPALLPPVYVLSHRRAHDLVTYRTAPWLVGCSTLVVTEEQEPAYRAAGWDDLLVIPAGYGGHDSGIGRALQYILETADLLGQGRIITLHDDLRGIGTLYALPNGKASQACAAAIRQHPVDFQRGCLALLALAGEDAYRAHPEALIACPQTTNPGRMTTFSRWRWRLNTGSNPAQLQYWAVDRFMDRVGGLNLADFNFHGEDISLACDIVAAGGATVTVPALVTGWSDYETDSVIRDPDTAPALRQGEHDALMRKTDLVPYIKTRYDIIGRPQWHSLDWAALKRDHLVKSDQALWTDPVRNAS